MGIATGRTAETIRELNDTFHFNYAVSFLGKILTSLYMHIEGDIARRHSTVITYSKITSEFQTGTIPTSPVLGLFLDYARFLRALIFVIAAVGASIKQLKKIQGVYGFRKATTKNAAETSAKLHINGAVNVFALLGDAVSDLSSQHLNETTHEKISEHEYGNAAADVLEVTEHFGKYTFNRGEMHKGEAKKIFNHYERLDEAPGEAPKRPPKAMSSNVRGRDGHDGRGHNANRNNGNLLTNNRNRHDGGNQPPNNTGQRFNCKCHCGKKVTHCTSECQSAPTVYQRTGTDRSEKWVKSENQSFET